MREVLRHAEALGAATTLFAGEMINLPMYVPGQQIPGARATAFLAALRAADAIIVASPSYHGGISGLVKNALDYTEEMARDPAPYFEGRAVGCIATGMGAQGPNATLLAIRSVVHALRGWPTPFGIALNTREPLFSDAGVCLNSALTESTRLMAAQLVGFNAGPR
jgi:FMN reductase